MDSIGMAAVFIFLSAALTAFFVFYSRKSSAHSARNDLSGAVLDIQRELAQLRSGIHEEISLLSRHFNEQLTKNAAAVTQTQSGYQDAVNQVQHRLGELQQASRAMIDIGKDMASLQDILRSPKLRGGMGELLLAELLRQILPEENFSLQYSFSSGAKVDAALLLGDGIIPVDAKFPLENFKRILDASSDEEAARSARKSFLQDIRKHIDAIADKYILPAESTFDFAIMYIPAENVYYETIIKEENEAESMSAYAQKRRVIPVSPNSFYAYLQVILRGLRGLRIERSAQAILQSLGQLETDFRKCLADFEKVGGHLGSALSAYERTEKRMGRIGDKLSSLDSRDRPLLETEHPVIEEKMTP